MARTSPRAGDQPRLLFVEEEAAGSGVGDLVARACAGHYDVWRVDSVNEAIRFLRFQAPFDEMRRPYVVVTANPARAEHLTDAIGHQHLLERVPVLVVEVTPRGHTQWWNATVADATGLAEEVEALLHGALAKASATA